MKKNNKIVIAIANTKSKLELVLNGKGFITELTPKIKNTLKILEPTTLPIAISEFLRYAAIAEVASSGIEDPVARIVKPIIDSLTPRFLAMLDAPSTINFPPKINPAIPIII